MVLASTVAAMLLAACGGGSNDDPTAGKSDDAKRQAFFECMRKAGLNVRETTGGAERAVAVQIPKGISPQRLQTIQRDCDRKTGGGPREPTKEEQAKFLDQALKFARCMRAHGVDIPDPQAGGGGILVKKRSSSSSSSSSSAGSGIDPKSPAFQRAQEACKSFMPGGKGGAKPMLSKGGGPGSDSGPSSQAVIGADGASK
jgi:hypothetical protein